MKLLKVPTKQVKESARQLLLGLGFTGLALLQSVRMAIEGWKSGVFTHGLNVIYINHGPLGVEVKVVNPVTGVAEPLIDPTATPEKIVSRGALEVWNGHGAPGPPTAYAALDRVVEMARLHGMGKVTVVNTGHVGCPGALTAHIAENGFEGRLTTFGGRVECVKPDGGQDGPRSSTNVVSRAYPTRALGALDYDIVVDRTLANVSMGRIRALIETGDKPLDSIEAYRQDGTRAEKPSEAFPTGAVTYPDSRVWAFNGGIETGASFCGFDVPSGLSALQKDNWQGDEEPKPDTRRCGFEIQAISVPTKSEFKAINGGDQRQHVEAFATRLFGLDEGMRAPGQRRYRHISACDYYGALLLPRHTVDWLVANAKFDDKDLEEIETNL